VLRSWARLGDQVKVNSIERRGVGETSHRKLMIGAWQEVLQLSVDHITTLGCWHYKRTYKLYAGPDVTKRLALSSPSKLVEEPSRCKGKQPAQRPMGYEPVRLHETGTAADVLSPQEVDDEDEMVASSESEEQEQEPEQGRRVSCWQEQLRRCNCS
jgi:hypothetical protein